MKISSIFQIRKYKGFFKKIDGVAAIEFALLGPMYLFLISAVFVVGIWLFANMTLTAVVNESASNMLINHPSTMQSDNYYKQFIQSSLTKYVSSGINKMDSTAYVDNTITYSITKKQFSNVVNSPVIVNVTVRYALPCPVPFISEDTFHFSFTGYAPIVGLSPT